MQIYLHVHNDGLIKARRLFQNFNAKTRHKSHARTVKQMHIYDRTLQGKQSIKIRLKSHDDVKPQTMLRKNKTNKHARS